MAERLIIQILGMTMIFGRLRRNKKKLELPRSKFEMRLSSNRLYMLKPCQSAESIVPLLLPNQQLYFVSSFTNQGLHNSNADEKRKTMFVLTYQYFRNLNSKSARTLRKMD